MSEQEITTVAGNFRSHRLKGFVRSHQYAWLSLLCAVMAAGLWYLTAGQAGPWPLLIGLLPWAGRMAAGEFPFKQTRFDPLLWLFLISALVGLWASYNQPAAWGKFWLIVGSLILYYAFAGQRSANLWPMFTGLAVFGGLIALYFLGTHDWNSIPAKIESLNLIGLRWMQWRPEFLTGLHTLHPNVAGGLMVMLFPFSLAAALRAVRMEKGSVIVISILSAALIIIGLVFTTSRGAWVALAGGLMIWAIWMMTNKIAAVLFISKRKAFGLGIIVLLGLSLTPILLTTGSVIRTVEYLPGPVSAGSRIEIARDALNLVDDFLITGSGLESFDGLYSQYIRFIPNHYLIHSHNLFLNVTVEQGMVGLISLVAILILAFWWLSDPRNSSYRRTVHGFRLANGTILASLSIVCLNGVVDDPLYGSRAVLLLWLPLGLTAFLFPLRSGWKAKLHANKRLLALSAGITSFILVILLVIFWKPIVSTWNSNLGALDMARVDLRGYPTNEWREIDVPRDLEFPRARFEKALALDPDNRTALHRLGLIAMYEHNYEAAAKHLYTAFLLDPTHRGIRKSLMYSYVWGGNISQALPLMGEMPEVKSELEVYRWWWSQKGYPDLSNAAAEVRADLESYIPNP